MKNYLLLLLIVFISLSKNVFSQENTQLKEFEASTKKDVVAFQNPRVRNAYSVNIPKFSKIILCNKFFKTTVKDESLNRSEDYVYYIAKYNGNFVYVDKNQCDLEDFNINYSILPNFWGDISVFYKEFYNQDNSFKGRISELDKIKTDYINSLEINNQIYRDYFLEDYLYSLVSKIYGDANKNLNLKIEIIANDEPMFFSFYDGTIVLSVGLLATLDSEDELKAVLCNEISHIVVGHGIRNYIKKKNIENTINTLKSIGNIAMATASIAGAVAGNTSSLSAFKTSANVFTRSLQTAVVFYGVAGITNTLLGDIGSKYTEKQVEEADYITEQYLIKEKLNTDLIKQVLNKVKMFYIYRFDLKGIESNPSCLYINERLGNYSCNVSNIDDKNYQSKISPINSLFAQKEYSERNYYKAIEYVDRNIKVGIALEDDYYLKVLSFKYLENYEDALKTIEEAQKISVLNLIELNKEKGLVLLRLKKFNEATSAFNIYLKDIEDSKIYDLNEIQWTKKMLYRISKE